MHRAALGVIALLSLPSSLSATPIQVAGDGHARIPFEVVGGHAWVQGTLNADSVWVVIDTGASQSVMDSSLTTRLGLKQHGSHESGGSGGVQKGATVDNVTLRIGGVTADFDELDTVDFGPLSHGRHPMQVVLGFELFQACVVRFDYPAGMLDVWDNAHAPKAASGTRLPLTFIDHHPYVNGVLTLPGQPPLKGRFVIDTGSNAGLILTPDDDNRETLAHSFPRTLEVVTRGVGGDVHNRLGRGDAFSLGDLNFNQPLVMIPDSTPGRFSAAKTMGNIGGQLLGRCTVTFDYAHSSVSFERGEGFERPFEADMSGLGVTRDSTGLSVRVVNPATPASEAGVEPGDVLTRIDGKPAATMDPAALRSLMQQEGRKVEIEFRRGDDTQTKTLTLRRLI